MFIGRETELQFLEERYNSNKSELVVLYGRRRVGKTETLRQFCKNKPHIFFSCRECTDKLQLKTFSEKILKENIPASAYIKEFSDWDKAFRSITELPYSNKKKLVVIDEFPYLVKKNKALLSELQHLIDHRLINGNIFMILCGSYMGFMEKEVLGSKSPLFGRRTAQLHMKPFNYQTSSKFLEGFSDVQKLELYGAFGGTPLYLQQISADESVEENIKRAYLKVISYLYEETLLLLRQEVQEPGVYSAIIEAIASGYTKANEISTKIGEDSAKCLKYIRTLCELGILHKETPFGEKESSRKTIYGISDFMFRFWYRYVFANRTLIETGAQKVVWEKRIEPDYNSYMGLVFEKVCMDYLSVKNANGDLPILFTSVGRWWGTNPVTHSQEEIDLVANDGKDYIFGECKWRNEKLDISVLNGLKEKADIFSKNRANTYYMLFSKTGFTDSLTDKAKSDSSIILVDLNEIMNF